jgi:hypothetical protein
LKCIEDETVVIGFEISLDLAQTHAGQRVVDRDTQVPVTAELDGPILGQVNCGVT